VLFAAHLAHAMPITSLKAERREGRALMHWQYLSARIATKEAITEFTVCAGCGM